MGAHVAEVRGSSHEGNQTYVDRNLEEGGKLLNLALPVNSVARVTVQIFKDPHFRRRSIRTGFVFRLSSTGEILSFSTDITGVEMTAFSQFSLDFPLIVVDLVPIGGINCTVIGFTGVVLTSLLYKIHLRRQGRSVLPSFQLSKLFVCQVPMIH
ncbi:hypothetical protein H6P81_015797 [Aristolochia fimbriata]|uniref:Uncharacterized protein n=1 Tax=Aristolochia fimbriata TaxID=158543 RepID=A0AAV7E6L7_ARIFI|nr:hypothetical protein H6P81_015797 [Aristolochia fimbriata]